jgi:hypothetical protein
MVSTELEITYPHPSIFVESQAMRFMRLAVVAAALTLIFAIPSNAQLVADKNRSFFSPDQQAGFGVNNRGLHVQYAMGPAFHLGLNLALDFYKDSSQSQTFFDFGPYAKFLFSGDVIKPFTQLSLGLIQPNTGSADITRTPGAGNDSLTVNLPDPQIRIYLGFGGEHFFNQNVGIYGMVNLLDAKVAGGAVSDPTFDIGLLGGTAGVEFFF